VNRKIRELRNENWELALFGAENRRSGKYPMHLEMN